MKRRILCVFMAVLTLMSAMPFISFAETETGVRSWQDLRLALESADNGVVVRLGENVDAGSTFAAIRVSGSKTLDLAGHRLTAADPDPASTSAMIEITAGSSLLVTDSVGGGEIAFDGPAVGRDKPYTATAVRDLFSVAGTLTVNGGTFTAGSAHERIVENAQDGTASVPYNGSAYQVVRGSAVTVKAGGSFTAQGGCFVGRYEPCVEALASSSVTVNDGKFTGTFGGSVFVVDSSAQITVRAGQFELVTTPRVLLTDGADGGRRVEKKSGVNGIPARALETVPNVVFRKNGKADYRRETALASLMTSTDSWELLPGSGNTVRVVCDNGQSGTITVPKGGFEKLILEDFTPHFPQGCVEGQDLYVEWKIDKVTPDQSGTTPLLDWTVGPERAGTTVALSSLTNAWEADCVYYVRARVTEKWGTKYVVRTAAPAVTVSVSKEVTVCEHSFSILVNTADCTKGGTVVRQCDKCGLLEQEDLEKTEEHTWEYAYDVEGDEEGCFRRCVKCGTVETDEEGRKVRAEHQFNLSYSDATCTGRTEIYVCSVCGYEKRETVEEEAHQFNDSALYREAEGHFRWCTVCGKKQSEEHVWVEEDGFRYCSVCGYYTNSLNPIVRGGYVSIPEVVCPHSVLTADLSKLTASQKEKEHRIFWYTSAGNGGLTRIGTGDTIDLGAVTDLSGWAGYQVVCQVMIEGDFGEESMTAAGVIATVIEQPEIAPTCVAAGRVKCKYCCGCGKYYDETGKALADASVPATGEHIYTDDCDRFCNGCGEARQAPHVFDTAFGSDKNAHYKVCTLCGFRGSIETHTAGQWIITEEGNCVTKGKRQLRCTECDRILADVTVPASAHSFDTAKTTAPTCAEAGKLVIACTVCGTSSSSILPACGHSLVTLGGVRPNCLIEGSREYYLCVTCGQYFEDAAATKPLTPDSSALAIDPSNHVGAVCGDYAIDEKSHRLLCACGAELSSGEHDFDALGVCAVCGYVQGDLLPSRGDHDGPDKPKSYTALTVTLWVIAATLFVALCVACWFLYRRYRERKAREEAMRRLAARRQQRARMSRDE